MLAAYPPGRYAVGDSPRSQQQISQLLHGRLEITLGTLASNRSFPVVARLYRHSLLEIDPDEPDIEFARRTTEIVEAAGFLQLAVLGGESDIAVGAQARCPESIRQPDGSQWHRPQTRMRTRRCIHDDAKDAISHRP